MRSFIAPILVAGLAVASPVPQDINFSLAEALPDPTYTIASDKTAQTVIYEPTAVVASAAAQITAAAPDGATDGASEAVGELVSGLTGGLLGKREACGAQPIGAGPVPSPDTAKAFLAYPQFASDANNAPTPNGYARTFHNLQASNNAYGYMGFTNLDSYDTALCAAKCDAINACVAVNIYYERDPSIDPADACPNPPSTTNIKCVFWGGPVTKSNAVNEGQWRNDFQVVIAGSNGYLSNKVTPPNDEGPDAQVYSDAVAFGDRAINAPLDVNGADTYMGSVIFTSGAFDASLCAAACDKKSAYNKAHPPNDGGPVQTCQFFNTYILYINTPDNVEGQYCAMYSQTWGPEYATNDGQWRGNDHYMIQYSFGYSNAADPGKPNPAAAVYQASKDIVWSTLQPFCSSYLGYSAGAATATQLSTTTPASVSTTTTTVFSTVTKTGVAKRQEASATASAVDDFVDMADKMEFLSSMAAEITAAPSATAVEKRAASVSVPPGQSKYPASILSSACSQNVKPAQATNTITITSVVTAATSVSTSTSTVTSVVTTTVAAQAPPAPAQPTDCGKAYKGTTTGFQISTTCNRRRAGDAGNTSTSNTSTQKDVNACVQFMDASNKGFVFEYEYATKTCTVYRYANEDKVVYQTQAAPGFAFGVYESLKGRDQTPKGQ